MAFEGDSALSIFRTAVSILRALEGPPSERVLTQRLMGKFLATYGQTYQSYQAIARQALRAAQRANQMTNAPTQEFGAHDLPIDPSLQPGDMRYNYRVLVIITDTDTGHEVRFAVDYHTDQPQSLDSLRHQAQNDFQSWAPTTPSRRAVAQVGSNVAIEVEILSAGRRG